MKVPSPNPTLLNWKLWNGSQPFLVLTNLLDDSDVCSNLRTIASLGTIQVCICEQYSSLSGYV